MSIRVMRVKGQHKNHLWASDNDNYFTACGRPVVVELVDASQSLDTPFLSNDDCRTCRRALEAGSLGWAIGVAE